jgi:hypothetical protein
LGCGGTGGLVRYGTYGLSELSNEAGGWRSGGQGARVPRGLTGRLPVRLAGIGLGVGLPLSAAARLREWLAGVLAAQLPPELAAHAALAAGELLRPRPPTACSAVTCLHHDAARSCAHSPSLSRGQQRDSVLHAAASPPHARRAHYGAAYNGRGFAARRAARRGVGHRALLHASRASGECAAPRRAALHAAAFGRHC